MMQKSKAEIKTRLIGRDEDQLIGQAIALIADAFREDPAVVFFVNGFSDDDAVLRKKVIKAILSSHL